MFQLSILCCEFIDFSLPLAAETEGRRRLISKSFHHQLKYHTKQPLVGKSCCFYMKKKIDCCFHLGPPESMREHVVAAAHAMRKGDWKKCRDYILSIKVSNIETL